MYLFKGFLELINNMLTTGMVPALFSDEEKEGIIGQVRSVKIQLLLTLIEKIFCSVSSQL